MKKLCLITFSVFFILSSNAFGESSSHSKSIVSSISFSFTTLDGHTYEDLSPYILWTSRGSRSWVEVFKNGNRELDPIFAEYDNLEWWGFTSSQVVQPNYSVYSETTSDSVYDELTLKADSDSPFIHSGSVLEGSFIALQPGSLNLSFDTLVLWEGSIGAEGDYVDLHAGIDLGFYNVVDFSKSDPYSEDQPYLWHSDPDNEVYPQIITTGGNFYHQEKKATFEAGDNGGFSAYVKGLSSIYVANSCPNDPDKTEPGVCGCGIPDTDEDFDGTPDCNDNCPNDPNKIEPGICGCDFADIDTDGDGIPDCNDNCNNSIDSDRDGISDCDDLCPNDSNKRQPGNCGCGFADSDTDSDGILDCNDDCLNDPYKIQPGTCGCGIAETDKDLDGTPDCIDTCPNDSVKAQPGICGCGVADTDSDGDGVPDCNDICDNSIDSDGDGIYDCDDRCPQDKSKSKPGTCGCGIADIDSDNDGIFDCRDSNNDDDGQPDGEEHGPNRDNPNFDGNKDGVADSIQDNVVSFHTFNNQNYVTLETPNGILIRNCLTKDNPSKNNTPAKVDFSLGFFEFSLDGVPGGTSTAKLYIPDAINFDTYYKYGPTPDNPINHWYEFLYDGQTGAEINGNVITLYFVDGMRGDDDITSNGTISDIGAPGISVESIDNGIPVDSGSGGGGGGCFITSANKGL